MELTGIDVHGSKGIIDWPKVRGAGHSFAFVKASEGSGFIDARTPENVAGARKAGLLVGCYHFARPDLGHSPGAEAEVFIGRIRGLPYTLAPVLDLERGNGNLSAWALTFLRRVEELTGHRPALYTYGAFIPGRLTAPELARYPLWLAAYRSSPPAAPRPWTSWSIWQHSSSGSVPGVPGRCDLNRSSHLPTIEESDDMTDEERKKLAATLMLATAAADTAHRVEERLKAVEAKLDRLLARP